MYDSSHFQFDLHLSAMMHVYGMKLLRFQEKHIFIHYEAIKNLSIQKWMEFLDTSSSSKHLQIWYTKLFNEHWNKQPKTVYDCLTIMCQCVNDCLLFHTQRGSMTVHNLLLQTTSTPPSINALTLMNQNQLYHQTLSHTLKHVCHLSKQQQIYFNT